MKNYSIELTCFLSKKMADDAFVKSYLKDDAKDDRKEQTIHIIN